MPLEITPPVEGELTDKGFTARLKIAAGQTKESLIRYGFTNYNKPTLYYMKTIDKKGTLSFNLSVCAETMEITDISVLQEEYLQPYDYQALILQGEPTEKAKKTYHKVNEILSRLQAQGVIAGFREGMYI